MKTKLYLCLLAMACLWSCGDDSLVGHVPDGNDIEVVKNDLLFMAAGGTASVEVSAPSAITATADADWCAVTVSGSVVSVEVQPNSNFEGRTALLTIRSNNSSRVLPVQQRGMVLGSLPESSHAFTNEGGEHVYLVPHDLPMDITVSESWLRATISGEQLVVSADPNVGGTIRRGTVVCESAGYRDTLRVAQYSLQDNIVGSYYIVGFYGGRNGQPVASRFDIVERDDNLFMHWPNQELWVDTYIQLGFDKSTATLFIPSAMELYVSGNNTDTGYFYDTEGTVAISSTAGASATLISFLDTGYVGASLVASNWAGHTLEGFIIRAVRAGGLVTQNILQIAQPSILRLGPLGVVEDGELSSKASASFVDMFR